MNNDSKLGSFVLIRVKSPIYIGISKEGNNMELVTIFRPSDADGHLAIIFRQLCSAVLVRVQSKFLTGNVLCLESDDYGILLYLRKNGHCIVLYNKIDMYHLQISQGFDTFTANRFLNSPEDTRDFSIKYINILTRGIDQSVNYYCRIIGASYYYIWVQIPAGCFILRRSGRFCH